MIVERQPETGAPVNVPTRVRETILQLLVSESFRLNDVWRGLTPLQVRAVAIARLQAFAGRSDRPRMGRRTPCRNLGRSKVKTRSDPETMVRILGAVAVGETGDRTFLVPGGERTRRMRTGRTAI